MSSCAEWDNTTHARILRAKTHFSINKLFIGTGFFQSQFCFTVTSGCFCSFCFSVLYNTDILHTLVIFVVIISMIYLCAGCVCVCVWVCVCVCVCGCVCVRVCVHVRGRGGCTWHATQDVHVLNSTAHQLKFILPYKHVSPVLQRQKV